MQRMQRIHRINTDNIHDRTPSPSPIHKSPLQKQPVPSHLARSPIRSRTPTRLTTHLTTTSPIPSQIKFIANISPVGVKGSNWENKSQLSNGKSLKYINNNFNDKIYQTVRKDKPQELNKKSGNEDNNRLFGKLVDKMNSGKKSGYKGQDSAQKTSVFAQNSECRYQVNRQEGGVFRHLSNQFKTGELRSDKKSSSRLGDQDRMEQSQGLSCLVYKIKIPSKVDSSDSRSQLKQNKVHKEQQKACYPSILLKRKSQKPEPGNEYQRKGLNYCDRPRVEESSDYSDVNIFLQKISEGGFSTVKKCNQDAVKMSLRVDESLNMDPFL